MVNYNVEKYNGEKNVENGLKSLVQKVLIEECGLKRFTESYLNKDYNDKDLFIFYIKNEENFLAMMMLRKIDDNVARIENVCCDAKYRGKGLADKLYENIINFSKQIGLEKLCLGTYDYLERAIGFYEKHGFVEKKEKRYLSQHSRYYELNLN